MNETDFYLGEMSREAAAYLEHMIGLGKCGLTIMTEHKLGDPNMVYIAKVLTKKQKKLEYKFE